MARRVMMKAKPPPKLTISEWSDKNRQLSSEASAEPGRWLTARAEFQRGIMDCFSSGVSRIALMCSAQVGKTEMLNNVCGFHIHQDPAPLLMLQPTIEMAETWSKDRLAPMLRDTPVLKDQIGDPRTRDSGNTILHKRFPGGHITAVGANSPAGLASRPIRIVLADEVDRYPPSAGAEGDPLSLAVKRTTTFWNSLVVEVSTPTIKGLSRIEREHENSDQRVYMVPCSYCNHPQRLLWKGVRWPDGEPERAAYHCEECDRPWTESDRHRAVKLGQWTVTNPAGRFPGFHISELYSPWSTIPKIAVSFIEAKKSAETMRVWVNTVLGEPYETDAEVIDYHMLSDPSRLEMWGEKLPLKCLLVTVGVDVQDDGFHIERVAWAVDEESWSVDYVVMPCDPSDPNSWRRLDAYLLEPSMREDGRPLPVRATCIDSGGHFTQTVYKFCKLRRKRRVFAIKGRDEATSVWPAIIQKKKDKVKDVTIVGVTLAKDCVYSRLKVMLPGPGYCHFPRGRAINWFEQLTSEIVQTKFTNGFPKRFYVLPQGKRNEALDCRVYAYAALQSLAVRWPTEALASRVGGEAAREIHPQPASSPSEGQPTVPPELVAASQAVQSWRQPTPAQAPRQRSGFLGPRAGGFSRGGWLRGR